MNILLHWLTFSAEGLNKEGKKDVQVFSVTQEGKVQSLFVLVPMSQSISITVWVFVMFGCINSIWQVADCWRIAYCFYTHIILTVCGVFSVPSGWQTADGERPAGTSVRQHEVQSCGHPGQVSCIQIKFFPPSLMVLLISVSGVGSHNINMLDQSIQIHQVQSSRLQRRRIRFLYESHVNMPKENI